MKCTKEIKKEVFDESLLQAGVNKAGCKAYGYNRLRIVMSHDTLFALRAEATSHLHLRSNSCLYATGSNYYEGCPIDINDGLAFGEVRFTTEVDV